MPSFAKRVLKLSISSGYFAASWVSRWLARWRGKLPEPSCTVLYYHSVPPYQRQLFARQMDDVCRLTTPILLDGRTQFTASATHYCCITFDDGFQSVIQNALPELSKRNIPAILFVTVNALGKRADWWPEAARYEAQEKMVTAEQLRSIPAERLSIGSHTLSHPRLTSLNDADATREIVSSRFVLEEALGRRVTLFSVPFGAFDDRIIRICRAAGYERVFTSRHTNMSGRDLPFLVGRVATQPSDWPIEFRLKLLGAYAWLPYASSLKQRFAIHRLISGFLTTLSSGWHHNSRRAN